MISLLTLLKSQTLLQVLHFFHHIFKKRLTLSVPLIFSHLSNNHSLGEFKRNDMSMFTQTTTGRVDQLGSLSQSQKHKTHKHTKYKHTAQSHTQGPGGAQKLEQRVGRRSPWWSWPHWGSSSARRPGRKRGLVKVTKALNTTYFENMNDTATCCPRCSKSLSMEAKPLAAV